jgi:hypothetical protein
MLITIKKHTEPPLFSRDAILPALLLLALAFGVLFFAPG